MRGVDGLLCLLTDRIDAEIMDAAGPGLKVISNHAVGVDNVDVAAASARGIPVGNTPGILTDATADMAFALLLAAARRRGGRRPAGESGRLEDLGTGLHAGCGPGRCDTGDCGFRAHRAGGGPACRGFGMRIIFTDPSQPASEPGVAATQVDFDTLLREADFISLHTPLTDETRGLINADTLGRMKPTAVLVNTSRGPVVDQQALYEALCIQNASLLPHWT